MAKKYNIVCPVCGQEFSGAVCDRCGWVHINMPEKVDVRVEDFQRRRLQAHKHAYESLRREVDAMESKLKSADGKLDELMLKDNERLAYTAKIEIRNVNLEEELNKARQLVEEYKQKAVEAAKVEPGKKLKGIALITGDESRTRMFLPVYEGMNTYGSNPTDAAGQHFKITMLFRGLKFKPQHFAIQTYGDRLVLRDLSGSITESAAPIPQTGIKTTPAMKFRLNENYYIIISEI